MNDNNDNEDDPMNETPSEFTINPCAPDLTQCPCHHCGIWRAWVVFQNHGMPARLAGLSIEAYMLGIWPDLPDEVQRIVMSAAAMAPPLEDLKAVAKSVDSSKPGKLVRNFLHTGSEKAEFDYARVVARIHQTMRPPQSEESDA